MKKLIIISLIILASNYVKSQEFFPFSSQPYAGVMGVQFNPASIADAEYKLDLNFVSLSFDFTNDFYSINRKNLLKSLSPDSDLTKSDIAIANFNGKDKNALIGLKVALPSFMLKINDNSSVAFTSGVRTKVGITNVSEDLARLLDSDFSESVLYNTKLENSNLNVNANIWAEYGLTYARVLYNNENHFIKAGATVKLLQGMGAGYIDIKKLSYEFTNQDTLAVFNSDVSYGTSKNFDFNKFPGFRSDGRTSFGFDIGAVYEYRTSDIEYNKPIDGDVKFKRADATNYKYKAAISITDMGSVNFNRNAQSANFTADIQDFYFRNLNIEDINDFNRIVDSLFVLEPTSKNFKMKLPTSINLQFDARLTKGVYLNFVPIIALNRGNEAISKSSYLVNYNLIPRIELGNVSFSLPMQVNELNQFKAGLGIRALFLWIGSNDLLTNLFKKNVYSSNIIFALKFPIIFDK